MEDRRNSLNDILVKLFFDILKIEEKCLRKDEFKDISINDMHIIENIGIGEGRNMSSTARDLKVTTGTLTTAVDNLIRKGYVIRQRSDEDRRVVLVKLTKKGKSAFKAHEEFHRDMVLTTLQDLNDEEEDVLIRALENVNKYFRKKYNY